MDDEKKGLKTSPHTGPRVMEAIWHGFVHQFSYPKSFPLMGKEVSGGNDEAKDWKNVKILHSGFF